MSKWADRIEKAQALYDFAPNGPSQIEIKAGEWLQVLKESSGWFKGYAFTRPDARGIFPVQYVRIATEDELPPELRSESSPAEAPAASSPALSPATAAEPAPQSSQGPSSAPAQPQPASGVRSVAHLVSAFSSSSSLETETVVKPVGRSGIAGIISSFQVKTEDKPEVVRSPTAAVDPVESVSSPSLKARNPPPLPGGVKFPLPATSPLASRFGAGAMTPISPVPVPVVPAPAPAPAPAAAPVAVATPPPAPAPAPAPAVAARAAVIEAKEAKLDEKEEDKDDEPVEGSLKQDMSFEALLAEITNCMRDWSLNMRIALENGNSLDYHTGMERTSALLELRSLLMDEGTSKDRQQHLRQEIIQLIESSRKMQEGYMVVRNQKGQLADTSNTGVVELLDLHRTMYSTLKESSHSMWTKRAQARRDTSIQRQKAVGPTQTFGVPRQLMPLLSPGPLQLFLDVKMCIFAVGEATEVLFSLYSHSDKRFLTEEFNLSMTAAGMPENINLIQKMFTVFKDLDVKDFERDLYLVCKIFRRGRLLFDPTKTKPPSHLYKRPFGCACTSLTQALEGMIGKEYEPPNAAMTIYTCREETSFARIQDMVISRDKSLDVAPRAKGIALGVRLHRGQLEQVWKDVDGRFNSDNTPITNKLGLNESLDPRELRHDFYLFLLGGLFSQDNKKSPRNIEFLIRIYLDTGTLVENCLLPGSGLGDALSEYRSTVYYHTNTPAWNETVRVRLQPELYERCHVLLTFWHVSTSAKNSAVFSFSYFKLTRENGEVIPDGPIQLPTFKAFPKIEGKEITPFYLNAKDKLVPRKEYVNLATMLCSTKKSQNPILQSLVTWRQMDPSALKNQLLRFTALDREQLRDVAKFLRELFDAFFAILASDTHSDAHPNLFKALNHLLALMTDKRITNQYQSLVDIYIQYQFTSANVHSKLLRLCTDKLESVNSSIDKDLETLTKTLHYVIKFVVASRQKDAARPVPTVTAPLFKASMLKMLQQVNNLVTKEDEKSPNLIKLQHYVVRSFPAAIKDIAQIFSPTEMGQMAANLVAAIPNSPNQYANKLNLIRNLLDGEVGENKESRDIVMSLVLDNVKTHIRSIESGSLNEPYLCVAILQKLLSIVLRKDGTANEECVWGFRSLLEDVMLLLMRVQQWQSKQIELRPPSDTVLQSCKVDMLTDSTTLAWTLLESLTGAQFDRFLAELPQERFERFVLHLLMSCKNSLTLSIYPDMWIVMNMLHVTVVAESLRHLAQPIRERCQMSTATATATVAVAEAAPEPAANPTVLEIWRQYFELSLGLLGSDQLKLHKFSKRKQQFVLSRYGDIRVRLIADFRDMWTSMGRPALRLSEGLIPRIFNLATSLDHGCYETIAHAGVLDVQQLQEAILNIYADIVCSEFSHTGDFADVERHTVDAFYAIAGLTQDAGGKFIMRLYKSLREAFQAKPELVAAGMKFLDHISRMYELMSSLTRFPDTPVYEDERTSVALKLMNYLDTTGHMRKEMHMRYVGYLVDLHVGLKNYIEAGVTQNLAIQMLNWSNNMLSPMGSFPAERERERKERLYRLAIASFVQGEEYERAISHCDDLRKYYAEVVFDYERLAAIHVEMADYFRRVVASERFYPNYFRVVYYGDFDDELKDKEFVYRGDKLEPIMDFTNRIKRKFPEAKIQMSSDAPPAEMLAQHSKIISITSLTRPTEEDRSVFDAPASGAGAASAEQKQKLAPIAQPPNAVAKYRENSDLRVFSYVKPVQKSKNPKPVNEFKHLWVLKTFLLTEESFPTYRRRCRIIERKEVWLRPVQNAIVAMVNKTKELGEKIDAVDAQPVGQADLNPLSMNLNGMIDAAVNGGTQKYIEAFCVPRFLEKNPEPESVEFQRDLKQALRDQIRMLGRGLQVFGKHMDAKLKPLFDKLIAFYGQMQEKTKEVLA